MNKLDIEDICLRNGGLQNLLESIMDFIQDDEDFKNDKCYIKDMHEHLRNALLCYKDRYKCEECNGNGWLSPNAPLRECPECEGIGYKQ